MNDAHSSEHIVTRSGCLFHVRPVAPADEDALAEFFRHVSSEDLRFRFLTGLREIGTDRLEALIPMRADVDSRGIPNPVKL